MKIYRKYNKDNKVVYEGDDVIKILITENDLPIECKTYDKVGNLLYTIEHKWAMV